MRPTARTCPAQARRRIGHCARALALLAATSATGQNAGAPPAACTSPERRQFDFWIGRRDVFLPDGNRAGGNVIEAIAGICALLESWSGRGGVVGKSINSYDAEDGRWPQTWVGSTGGRLELSGTLRDGSMVLTSATGTPGKPGERGVQRLTWTPRPDGSVRQAGRLPPTAARRGRSRSTGSSSGRSDARGGAQFRLIHARQNERVVTSIPQLGVTAGDGATPVCRSSQCAASARFGRRTSTTLDRRRPPGAGPTPRVPARRLARPALAFPVHSPPRRRSVPA